MTDTPSRPKFIRTLGFSVGLLLLGFAALVVTKELGWIETGPARRGVSALLGLLLVVCGNYLPKLTGEADADAPLLARADRAAGRLLMLTGLAFAGLFILAPLDIARTAGPLTGLVGAWLAILAWGWAARRATGGAARLAVTASGRAVRLAVTLIVISIVATFGLFEIDRLWGDRAAQWAAIILTLLLVFAGASPWVRAASRNG